MYRFGSCDWSQVYIFFYLFHFLLIFVKNDDYFTWSKSVIFSDPPYESLDWSSMNQIFMFIILRTDYFQLWFIFKSDLRISTADKNKLNYQKNTFKPRKTTDIFHIIDQIKVSRVPLWIGHCHLYMEGHLKLRLQSL